MEYVVSGLGPNISRRDAEPLSTVGGLSVAFVNNINNSFN